MPGWYVHMDVARKAIDQLSTNATANAIFGANGPDAVALTSIAHANPTYVALGAIGPDIFFLLPDFKPPVGSMLWKLANFIMEVFTWWDDNFLGPFESAMGPISDNAADEINALTGGLKDTLEAIFSQAFSFLEDKILDLILQQYDFFGLLSSGVPAGFDEASFFWSDMLHYRETYRFAAVLWHRANDATIVPDATDRARFQAFALGWMTHLATDVTGHAFVNQKAGGPYRLHWQRHHLVENHMDAQVYNADHGTQAIYQEMSNSALHLWLAFNPDGSSRVNFFDSEPNPTYPDGDASADIVGRHAVWDVDSDMPDDLAQFLSDGLKAVYWPETTPPPAPFLPQSPNTPLNASATGPISCCPTIISTLDGRVPIETGGFANKDDITGAYWWLYKYVKFTTTDYYKIRRPDPPSVLVIPSFPSPPGSGDSDPGPGAGDDSSTWQDILSFLLDLFAWASYLAEVAVWPVAAIAGITAGTATYPLREAIYESLELPLYNLWLGVHTYMAMTGYLMPMPGEINTGLNTLGVSVSDQWQVTVTALGDPDGGLTPNTLSSDPSGSSKTSNPKDVVMDAPGFITSIFNQIFENGAPDAGGKYPSEFTRPWRWPDLTNAGNAVNTEQPANEPGPYTSGMNATALFGSSPGSPAARVRFEAATSEADTLRAAFSLLPANQHLGDPQDYTAYVIARLTRLNLEPGSVINFNLDADRGYGYLCWDWLRFKDRESRPKGFVGNGDPSHGNQPTPVSEHQYPTPVAAGYGWSPTEQFQLGGQPALTGFDPANDQASVRIRYIDKEGKFQ
jgi:hypothetical protein